MSDGGIQKSSQTIRRSFADLARQCAEGGSPADRSEASALRAQVDEIGRAGTGLEEVPALHPVVGALELFGRDRCRIDQIEAALAQIVDGELIDQRIAIGQ